LLLKGKLKSGSYLACFILFDHIVAPQLTHSN